MCDACLVVEMADRLTTSRALFGAYEVAVVEMPLEVRYPEEDATVIVVVTQLVIATWHCCAEDVLEKT